MSTYFLIGIVCFFVGYIFQYVCATADTRELDRRRKDAEYGLSDCRSDLIVSRAMLADKASALTVCIRERDEARSKLDALNQWLQKKP